MQQQTADKAQGMGKAAEAVLQLVEAIQGHQAEDTKRRPLGMAWKMAWMVMEMDWRL